MKIPELLLEKVFLVAKEIPYEILDPVITLLHENGKSDLAVLRRKALKNIGQPRFRHRLVDLFETWEETDPNVSPQTVATSLSAVSYCVQQQRKSESIELIWTGPSSLEVPLRRTDQALQEIINGSQHTLTIVSFAVYKIALIKSVINTAVERGVVVRIIIESSKDSEGKLTVDAVHHMRKGLAADVRLYVWPSDKRSKDQRGNTGVLHAKCAVADSQKLFVSSANLTESALSINMELGVIVGGGSVPRQVETHFTRLIEDGVLLEIKAE